VRVLHLRGIDAEEAAPGDVDDLGTYEPVVLGSAVYEGRWLEPATSLVARCALQLADRPVWLFSSGPIEHRVFPGKLDRAELGPLERVMVPAVHAPQGDHRDWGEVTRWASQIADTLVGAEPAG
jgi:menaquinone-dependent protoporphyrinogen oxidase